MVFKPSPYHNLRFSFNQAANPLPASDLYFDLPIQTVPGVFDVWITGAVNPYTFGSNPQIDWLIPDVPNTPVASGFPLAAAYAAVTGSVLEGLTVIAATNPSLAQLLPIVSGVLQDPTSAPSPYGKFFENVKKNLFVKHPYKHTTIGEMDHLDAASLEEFLAFNKKYYVPNNAILVVASSISNEFV